MVSQVALAELKLRNPCDQVAGQWVALREHGKKLIGPCPLHSPDPRARDSTAFECDADGWVCASCHDGGDVIRLVMKRERVDFIRAIEILGGAAEPDPERAAELERERELRKNKREQEANAFRERERRTAFDIWHAGERWPGTPVERYLKLRGLEELPERLPLRYAAEVAYFHGQEEDQLSRKSPRVIWRGPAMLAPIVDAGGKFRAVHCTWLDIELAGGKAIVVDPDSGETLPAKKVRGSKAGNVIRLVEPCPLLPQSENAGSIPGKQAPSLLVIGEGVETTISVWFALLRAGRDLSRLSIWSSVDLGNLAGKSADSVPHPGLVDARGRVRRVPGPQPDMGEPGIIIPAEVDELVLLRDGDSDPYTTGMALARAAARYARPGLAISCACAAEGKDFNDELREAA